MTQPEAAELLNVSGCLVRYGAVVEQQGVPAMIAAVAQGHVAVSPRRQAIAAGFSSVAKSLLKSA